jgi:hypothetical protein
VPRVGRQSIDRTFDPGLDGRGIVRDLEQRANVPGVLRATRVELEKHQPHRTRYRHRHIAERQALGRFDDLSLPGLAAHDDVHDLVAFAQTHAPGKRIVESPFRTRSRRPLASKAAHISPQHPRVDAREVDICSRRGRPSLRRR